VTTTDPSLPPSTQPQDAERLSTARVTVVQASVQDRDTGALFIHKDLVQVIEPWAREAHLGPIQADERFGDVDSWASYVKRHARADSPPFIAWTSGGLRAVLDYHNGTTGRCQWVASHPFVLAPAFVGWRALADNRARSQREVVEWLEGHMPDIQEPAAGELLPLLRTLRTTVNKSTTVELQEDGTSSFQIAGDGRAGGRGGVAPLPAEFTIVVQVLKGHVEPATVPGEVPRPVLYRFSVRMRVDPGNDAHPVFRFEIPLAERILEDVYADRVQAARDLLGPDYEVLRGAERG
jgi:Uncharacterized conserved protein (DUF2303)